MTTKIPKKNVVDKLLEMFGKRRAIFVPDGEKKLGQYVYLQARKESIFKTIMRPRNAILPDGWVYIEDLIIEDEDKTS